MLSNYHTLGYIASSLQATLPGRTISQVYTQNPDEMAVAFQAGDQVLIFSCRVDTNTVYLHDHFARARSNSTDVLPAAVGTIVSGVSIHPSDRVLIIDLSSGTRILLQFFGAQANALLVDPEGAVIDAFKSPRSRIGSKVHERAVDVLYDVSGLPAQIRASGTTQLATVLRSTMPTLGTTLVRELLYRASLSPATRASTLEPVQIDSLIAGLQWMLNEIGTPQYRIYSDKREIPIVFSLIPLRHLADSTERQFDDIHAAVRYFVGRRRAAADIGEQLTSLRTSLRQHRDRSQRSLLAMDKDAQESGRADEYERWGHILLTHIDRIEKGDAVFIFDGIRIPLDRALTPARNAQRFFEKAKRSRATVLERSVRTASTRERLAAAERLLEMLDSVSSTEDFRLFQQENSSALELLGLSEKAKRRAEFPFRVFTVEGQFEVWVGKSSENNDLLTLHHAKPNDLWFHARGSSGSHVLLKIATGKGVPGKRAKEQAAAIAAYFSKMRTASTVPVAMTERKYVRKPKGAPSGTVVLQRESVLFVTPALPADRS